jgi:hypothetical protein
MIKQEIKKIKGTTFGFASSGFVLQAEPEAPKPEESSMH